MADLESNAAQTIEQLERLLTHSGQVESSLAQTKAQLSTMVEEVEANWQGLSNQANELLQRILSEKEQFLTEAENLKNAIQEAKNPLEPLPGEIDEALESTKGAISEFNEKVESMAPNLESQFDELAESVSSLTEKTQTVRAEIEETISETEDYLLNQVNAEIKNHQAELEERVEQLQNYITEEYLVKITEKTTDFNERFNSIVEKLTTKMEDLAETTEEAAEETLSNLEEQIQDEIFGNLIDKAKEIEQLMDRLSTIMDTTTSTVMTSKDLMVDGMNATNLGLNTAVGILDEIKELLESVT